MNNSSKELSRNELIQQVLEYWYTVDFLSQGALHTEQTRQEKENYSFAMKYPFQFGTLFIHRDLETDQSIIREIKVIERRLEEKRAEINPSHTANNAVCHGKATVFIGEISRAWLTEQLAGFLGCELPDNPSSDTLSWASLQLTDDGRYIKDTFSVSPVIWALEQIRDRQHPASMYEVLNPETYQKAGKAFEPSGKDPIDDYDSLLSIAKKMKTSLIDPLVQSAEEAELQTSCHFSFSIFRNSKERTRRESEDYHGLSMSFYASDLLRLKSAIESDNWCDTPMWKALADMICAPYDMEKNPVRDRIDLSLEALRNPETLNETKKQLQRILSMDQMPLGKWPSKYQPFFMQQVAVNLAVNQADPILAVNGPPGTGKTTLLKEIVADTVVRKALILSRFDRADDAFEKKETMVNGQKYTYFAPPAEIKKYGLIVASSNNAAVDNISKQLPLLEPMMKGLEDPDVPWLDLVRKHFDPEEGMTEIIRKKNFDKPDQPVEQKEFRDVYFSPYATRLLLEEPCWGLISAALGRRANIVRFYNSVLSQLNWDFYKQPGFCRSRQAKYEAARTAFLNQYQKVVVLRDRLQQEIQNSEARGESKFGSGPDEVHNLTDEFLSDLSSHDPAVRLRAQTQSRHISQRFDREREILFSLALRFTKEFVLTSEICSSNFNLLGKAWGVETYNNQFAAMEPSIRNEYLKKGMASWIQTMQILVPVISTTFASAGNCFKYVNHLDALGTIIVDEAGQATPQMAVSLFSKASRAVIVGDPNQIEPVVSDELSFLETTLDESIGSAYTDRTLSVQKIADWMSRYGGIQTDSENIGFEKIVGVPLYVHSRCIEPMFSISNLLSYGNAMLRITKEPEEEEAKSFCYPVSQWINVSGREEKKKNHFIREQGCKAMELLNSAFAQWEKIKASEADSSGPDLFIISPFHTVAEGMRQLLTSSVLAEYPVLFRHRDVLDDWINDDQNPHIGTVHTFQGREAKEVIFLLGCDEQSKKSANWVKKNIVNVAVTRARYRLYVIGDVHVWDHCDPVMDMKYTLDSYIFDQLSGLNENRDTSVSEYTVPMLPTSEIFPIESISSEPDDEEYLIDTTSTIENVRAYVAGLGNDFTPEQLSRFHMASMEDFASFPPKIQNLLRTGMWNYIWFDSFKSQLSSDFDVSFIGICFAKAFELFLKQNYFQGLKALVPEAKVKGEPLSSLNDHTVTIGDYPVIMEQKKKPLAAAMARLGYKDYDADWWNHLADKIRKCKHYRNTCAHPGNVFPWTSLEDMLSLLFEDSKTGSPGLWSKEYIIHGLLFENNFGKIISSSGLVTPVQTASVPPSAIPPQNAIVKTYCKVTTRIRKCQIDQTPLEQKVFDVLKKDGQAKKMNMQYCSTCKRKYINIYGLSQTQDLRQYQLTGVSAADWNSEE